MTDLPSLEYVATTKNEQKVYVDLEESHAATHLADTPGLLRLAKEVLVACEPEGEQVYFGYDVGRIVGTTDLVETSEDDDIVYAKRPNRDIYTRFVRGRQSLPTSFVSIVLRRIIQGYELWSIWTGPPAPMFPGDEYEQPESKEFWERHALVWGRQEIQPGTETKVCPWEVRD